MSSIPSLFGRRSNLFSLEAFDPFEAFARDIIPSTDLGKDVVAVANTQIHWKETPQALIFKGDLNGLKKEEVKIEVENGSILRISGERVKEEKDDKCQRLKRSWGKFMRCFRLPENANVEEMKATMEKGVLTVIVPKLPEPTPQAKTIEIAG